MYEILSNGSILRSLSSIYKSEREVNWGNGISNRYLIKKDGFPFGFHYTIVKSGSESFLEYKNHIEACFCIDGTGEIEIDGKIYPINRGTLYALKHNKHILRASKDSDLHLICIFYPALEGNEKHKLSKYKSSSY